MIEPKEALCLLSILLAYGTAGQFDEEDVLPEEPATQPASPICDSAMPWDSKMPVEALSGTDQMGTASGACHAGP